MKKFNLTTKVTKAAGLVAGGVATRYVSQIPGVSSLDPTLQAAVKLGIGIVAPEFLPAKAKKSDLVNAVFDGMVTVGGIELAGTFIPGVAGINGINGGMLIAGEGIDDRGNVKSSVL